MLCNLAVGVPLCPRTDEQLGPRAGAAVLGIDAPLLGRCRRQRRQTRGGASEDRLRRRVGRAEAVEEPEVSEPFAAEPARVLGHQLLKGVCNAVVRVKLPPDPGRPRRARTTTKARALRGLSRPHTEGSAQELGAVELGQRGMLAMLRNEEDLGALGRAPRCGVGEDQAPEHRPDLLEVGAEAHRGCLRREAADQHGPAPQRLSRTAWPCLIKSMFKSSWTSPKDPRAPKSGAHRDGDSGVLERRPVFALGRSPGRLLRAKLHQGTAGARLQFHQQYLATISEVLSQGFLRRSCAQTLHNHRKASGGRTPLW
mmetsp:Transcript_71381/g.201429  ORF Transcript_71381/g.201429 Transcript_71381/m.201429 type:complete len:312 (+) Transcript_71381:641-1576(+)